MFISTAANNRRIRRSNFGKVFATRAGRRMAQPNYENLSGMGQVTAGTIVPPADAGSGGSFLDSITSIFQTAIPAYAQYRLTKTNVDLIKQGKAPLDPASIAPVVRVQHSATATAGQSGMMRMAMIGAGVLVGGVVIMKMLKR